MKGLLSVLLLGAAFLSSIADAQDVVWRAVRPEPSETPPDVQLRQVVWKAVQPEPSTCDASAAGVQQVVWRPAQPETPAPRPPVIRLSGEALDLTPVPAATPTPPPPHLWGSYCAADAGVPSTSPDESPGLHDLFVPENERFYARAEYLMWWFKEARLPPLVTTGPNEPNGLNGILGMPGTIVLFGGSGVGGNVRSGTRLTAGAWLDEDCGIGIEASAFFIGQQSYRFAANSDTFPVLARPFFSLNARTEFAQETATPGQSVGSVSVTGPSRLWGAEINLRCNLCCDNCGRLDLLVGPRYMQLDERLQIQESLLGLADADAFAGSRIQVTDRFDTHNQFYGAQAGLNYRLSRGPWSLDVLGKLAFGETHQVVEIAGGQTIVSPSGAVTTANGGFLALSTNSGKFTRDRFAVVPELGATVGWQVTDWCRLSVGFNALYWSSVVRPGDQIDRVLDETLIPNFMSPLPPTGIPRPAATVRDTDFWAYGITFGVEIRY